MEVELLWSTNRLQLNALNSFTELEHSEREPSSSVADGACVCAAARLCVPASACAHSANLGLAQLLAHGHGPVGERSSTCIPFRRTAAAADVCESE